MIADLPKNREIGAGWSGLFVLHFLLSGSFTENWPALFSFSYGMPVERKIPVASKIRTPWRMGW
jgi:hypothetical protein